MSVGNSRLATEANNWTGETREPSAILGAVMSRIGVMRRENMDISQSRLQEVLEYHKESGIFTWKVAPRGKKLGVVAGTNNQLKNAQADAPIWIARNTR